MNPISLVAMGVESIFGFFKGKQELKRATQSATAKLQQKKLDTEASVELSDVEWEALALKTQENSWKDEYVTLIITIPIPLIILGAVLASLGFPQGLLIVSGTIEGIKELKNLGMDYGFLMNAVVMAAIGLKIWRRG